MELVIIHLLRKTIGGRTCTPVDPSSGGSSNRTEVFGVLFGHLLHQLWSIQNITVVLSSVTFEFASVDVSSFFKFRSIHHGRQQRMKWRLPQRPKHPLHCLKDPITNQKHEQMFQDAAQSLQRASSRKVENCPKMWCMEHEKSVQRESIDCSQLMTRATASKGDRTAPSSGRDILHYVVMFFTSRIIPFACFCCWSYYHCIWCRGGARRLFSVDCWTVCYQIVH